MLGVPSVSLLLLLRSSFLSPSAQWSASVFVSACFANLLSADEKAAPIQPFLACLPDICSSRRLPPPPRPHLCLPPSWSFAIFRCSAPLASCLPLTLRRYFTAYARVFALQPLVDIKTQNITLSDTTQSVTCFLRSLLVWNHLNWANCIIVIIIIIIIYFKS